MKRREDFPTTLKYKYYVLSQNFPEYIKSPLNPGPKSQLSASSNIKNGSSISKVQIYNFTSNGDLPNWGISSIHCPSNLNQSLQKGSQLINVINHQQQRMLRNQQNKQKQKLILIEPIQQMSSSPSSKKDTFLMDDYKSGNTISQSQQIPNQKQVPQMRKLHSEMEANKINNKAKQPEQAQKAHSQNINKIEDNPNIMALKGKKRNLLDDSSSDEQARKQKQEKINKSRGRIKQNTSFSSTQQKIDKSQIMEVECKKNDEGNIQIYRKASQPQIIKNTVQSLKIISQSNANKPPIAQYNITVQQQKQTQQLKIKQANKETELMNNNQKLSNLEKLYEQINAEEKQKQMKKGKGMILNNSNISISNSNVSLSYLSQQNRNLSKKMDQKQKSVSLRRQNLQNTQENKPKSQQLLLLNQNQNKNSQKEEYPSDNSIAQGDIQDSRCSDRSKNDSREQANPNLQTNQMQANYRASDMLLQNISFSSRQSRNDIDRRSNMGKKGKIKLAQKFLASYEKQTGRKWIQFPPQINQIKQNKLVEVSVNTQVIMQAYVEQQRVKALGSTIKQQQTEKRIKNLQQKVTKHEQQFQKMFQKMQRTMQFSQNIENEYKQLRQQNNGLKSQNEKLALTVANIENRLGEIQQSSKQKNKNLEADVKQLKMGVEQQIFKLGSSIYEQMKNLSKGQIARKNSH